MDVRTTYALQSRNQTYVYLWSYKQFQQEQVEWDDVNKRLQHHGFKPVFFADPAENKSPADLVLLDKKSAAELRTTLRMMLTDSERRQALIQELVMSNNQLKMEVQEHMSRAAQQSQAVQQHSHTQQLQKEKLEAHRRCEVLEQKLLKQKEEATQLQRKLHFITKKEEQRLALQRQTSQQRSPADQQGNFLSSSPKQDGTAEISELISDPAKEARLCVYYHHLLNEISAVVADHKAPLRVHKLERSDFQDVLSTLKVWAEQLDLLKGLQCRLKELSVRLMPLQPCDGGYNTDEGAEVGDMMLLVDAMLENASADDKVLRSPTRHTLESMVSHFQKLFDVTSLRGVYPRMNEIYTKLGEMTNAMRNLRDILDLDCSVSPAEVVKHVSRLVSSTESMARFPELLGDIDIDSIIMKVKQHEEFFPAFHALVTGILQTLGVSHLDDILPALKALTETAQ
ncbi:centrosomal protein of 70 kDa isoform X1 [Oreochromis aureus]|uniref:centrosomal protein of 70 kDa isoform X1 n=2 Tax=Oreochromis aureus TaxID=47969 RepID=UPI0012BC9BD0|nr:centrosomal protein of 70 kDa isoform X1 [Oreochromis aureus]